jgi:hypothetical protein
MNELNEYVAQKNSRIAMFNGAPLDLANAKDRQRIARSIDSALSPENLACDGELSANEVNAKYQFLSRAAEQLMRMDPTIMVYEF